MFRKAVMAMAIFAAAAMLPGCASVNALETGVTLATKSIANPITRDDLFQVESGLDVVFKALNLWKKACLAGAAEPSCRAHVVAVQKYTTPLPSLVDQLRGFVKNNDQVNAHVVYDQFTQLYNQAKTVAASFGITLGG